MTLHLIARTAFDVTCVVIAAALLIAVLWPLASMLLENAAVRPSGCGGLTVDECVAWSQDRADQIAGWF